MNPLDINTPNAWYALRRFMCTWNFERNLNEMTEKLPQYGVDELVLITEAEECYHGQPTVETIEGLLPYILKTKEVMESLGIVFSLNPWTTHGHVDRGRDGHTRLPGLQTMVGHDGVQCTDCACTLSPIWRETQLKIWRLYAQSNPHVMWVDDDIRTFNHMPVRFGCFCPLHMERFSKKVGWPVARESLVKAMLAEGEPHPWRRIYQEMHAEIMEEFIGQLARAVHEVSPLTSMGLMSSGPRTHSLESRHWQNFAQAMADGKMLYSRPPMGSYSEQHLRGLYYSQDSIKITRACLPEGTVEQTEVENFPYTRFNKSSVFTYLQMAASFALGCRGVTLNLFDGLGTDMEEEPTWGRMLAGKKPLLEALAERSQQPGRVRGVGLVHRDHASAVKPLPAGVSNYEQLAEDGYAMAEVLETMGVATTYEASDVKALCGHQVSSLTDHELREIFSGGVLIDAIAALDLHRRGLGRWAGLQSIQAPVCADQLGPLAAEEYFNPAFDGQDKLFMTLTIPDMRRPEISVIQPANGAKVISQAVDPDAKPVCPLMYAFANELGGRVVVQAFALDTAFGMGYASPRRQRQIQAAVRWIARDSAPLMVRGGGNPWCMRKDGQRFTLVSLFNLTLDAWDRAQFEMAYDREVERIEVLSPQGRWEENPALAWEEQKRTLNLTWDAPVAFDQPLFITIFWQP